MDNHSTPNTLQNLGSSEIALAKAIQFLDENPAFNSECSIWKNGHLMYVYAYVHIEEETWFSQFCRLLNSADYAHLIGGIEIKGADEGELGNRDFDLTELLGDDGILFHNLREFEVEQTSVLHDNITTISFYNERKDNVVCKRILDKMPALRTLVIPIAPSPYFFERHQHPLEELSIQVAYEHHGFLARLAASDCFPLLDRLEWFDGKEDFGIAAQAPLEHYQLLLENKNQCIQHFAFNSSMNPEILKMELIPQNHNKNIVVR